MRIVLVLESSLDPVLRIEEALSLRGHRVLRLDGSALDDARDELSAADLVVVDAEVAERSELVPRLATAAPGIEFVLVGTCETPRHPDVIDRLDRPLELDRLLRIVDDLADVLDGERLREPIELVAYETVFAGDSPQIRELLRRVRLIARSEAPVWIYGDDGSGRSTIARAIHDRSSRRNQPFLAFNIAAYADDDLCRRLFDGDEAAVVAARAGTLFLERIATLGPNTQRELVNYLETANQGASPRLIVGIQRDSALDGAPQFLSPDLYYRLKVLEVEIPSLKDRVRDLEQIVGRMLDRLAATGKQPAVSADTMQTLARYTFPGNFVELAHALTHAFVLASGGAIEPEHLPISIRKATTSDGDLVRALDGELEALDIVAKRFERDYLLRVLRSVGGNRGRAAEILGLSRKGLWGKLKSHGISDDDIETVD